jgi:hypothetical protein
MCRRQCGSPEERKWELAKNAIGAHPLGPLRGGKEAAFHEDYCGLCNEQLAPESTGGL